MNTQAILVIVALVVTFVVLELVTRLGGKYIVKWAPGWKTDAWAIGLRLLGIFLALDPSILAPLFGDNPWAGVFIFAIGQMQVALRDVTFTSGRAVPDDSRAAYALHTLISAPTDTVEKGLEEVNMRQPLPGMRVKAARLTDAVLKVRDGGEVA